MNRVARAAGAFLLAAALAGASASAAFAASSPSPDPASSASPSPVAAELAPTLTIASYGPAYLIARQPLVGVLTIENPTSHDEPDLQVAMRVTEEPLADGQAFRDWYAGDDAAVREVSRADVGGRRGLDAGTSTSVRLATGPTAAGMPTGTAGVYGVEFTLENGGVETRSVRTVITWVDAPIPTTRVAVVVSVSGSEARVDALLKASGRTEVTLAVDPFAVTAEQADLIANRDVYLLPGGDVDLASVARADESPLLARALVEGRDSAAEPLADRPWLAVMPALGDRAYAAASQLGTTAVLIDPRFAATSDAGMGVALVSGSETPAVVPDPLASEILSQSGANEATRAARGAAAAALLAFATPSDSVAAVALGSNWVVEGDTVSASLVGFLDAPWIDPITLSGALTHATGEVELVPNANDPSDIAPGLVANAATALERLETLAAATSDPELVAGDGSRSLLASLAYSGRVDPAVRDDHIRAEVAKVTDLRASLGVPAGSSLNLLSASGKVPLTIRNGLPADVTVRVELTSNSPNLVVLDRPVVTIPAGTEQQVHVAVEAVSSADVTARVTLTDEDGNQLSPPTFVRVRVRADWGDAFTIALAVGASALLVAGLFRTLRRGRRDTRLAPDDPRAAAAGADVVGDEDD